MTTLIRILVADDHPVMREGLVSVLNTQADFDVIAEASDGNELVEKALGIQPDLILTDLEMPQLNGVDAIRQIRTQWPAALVLVFTAFDTDDRIIGALQAGAKGYLLKGAPREDIFKAIRVVHQGGSLLEPQVATKLIDHMQDQTNNPNSNLPEPLTAREMEVLGYLGKGMTNKEIAATLFITERTVKFYVSAILGKLGAGNRTEAVTIAASRGLLQL